MTSIRTVKFVAAALFMVGALAFLYWRGPDLRRRNYAPPNPPAPKKVLPIDQKIEAVGVVDLDGKPVATRDLVAGAAGKPLVVAFWSIT